MPNFLRSAASQPFLIAVVISAFALPGHAIADVETDLAQAAKSPYDIARFVDTHKTFDWAPLWKALGIDPNPVQLMPCEGGGRLFGGAAYGSRSVPGDRASAWRRRALG